MKNTRRPKGHILVGEMFNPEAFTKAAQEALERDVPEGKYEEKHTPAQKAAMEKIRLTHKAWSLAMTKSNQCKNVDKLAKLRETLLILEKAYREASNERDRVFGHDR